jgi:tetratricopeptide (TPR) repeat protein
MLGLYDEELDTWETIIDIDPNNNSAINAIISVLGKMGRDPKAFYQKAWENNISDASKALSYINALFNENDYKSAITVASQTLALNPTNETLVKKLAECYEYNGQAAEGLKVLEKYARSNPRDINMQIDVTNKNVDVGNYEKAYNIISSALKIAPQNKEVFYARAKVLETVAEMSMLEKGKIDCNDKIVYHMAFEDYKVSKKLGNFNAQFRIKYLYDNDLTIAKANDRFLIGDANKAGTNTYKALGASYSWKKRTVRVE